MLDLAWVVSWGDIWPRPLYPPHPHLHAAVLFDGAGEDDDDDDDDGSVDDDSDDDDAEEEEEDSLGDQESDDRSGDESHSLDAAH